MGVSSSESHDLTAFYEMLSASFGVLSQNTGFYPSLDRIIETMLGPLNLGPGGGSYNKPISRLHRIELEQGPTCCHMDLVIICKLHQWEPVGPVVLSMAHKDSEIGLYLLVHALHLAISLQAVGSGGS